MRSVAAGWSEPTPNLLQASRLWGEGNPVGTSSVAPPQQLTLPSGDVSPVIGNLGSYPVTAAAHANALRLASSMSQFGPADVGAIRAYHGSPADFSAFDDRYIGSGEGNQAYGYGHYAAGDEGVADYYRKALSGSAPSFTGAISPAFLAALKAEDYLGFDSASQAVAAMRSHPDWQQRWDVQDPGRLRAAFDAHEQAKYGGQGHMYEVNIDADPEHMLDWDAPLSEQHPVVKRYFFDEQGNGGPGITPETTGAEAHRLISRGQEAAVSASMRDAGIPGIRYLDQGSRGKGEGTSNFVIFDPKNIEILRKYGIGGLIAGGGVAAATGGQDQQ